MHTELEGNKVNLEQQPRDYQFAEKIKVASVLAVFDSPIREMDKTLALKTMLEVFKEVFSVSLAWIAAPLLHMYGLVLMNAVGNTTVQAGFGIALSFYELFFYTFMVPVMDKMGIELSRAYGAKNKQLMKRLLWQGTVAAFLAFALFTSPLMSMSGWLLQLVGVKAETAEVAQEVLWLLQVSCILEVLIFLMQTFCFSQGVEDVFTAGSVVAFLLGASLSSVLVLRFGLGMYGWLAGKLTFNAFILALTCWKFSTEADKETWGKISWKELQEGLGFFILESFKFAFGTYSEYIGYEITNLFVYMNPDQEQVTAFVTVMNSTVIMYCLSEAAALVSRTRINMLVGLRRIRTGKSFFGYFLLATFFFGCCYSLILLLANPWIESGLASSNPALTTAFNETMGLYRWFCIQDSMYLSVIMTMKSLGKVNLLLWINVLLLGVANCAGNYLIAKVWKLRACYHFLWIYILQSLMITCWIAYIFFTDWEKATFELDEYEIGMDQLSLLDTNNKQNNNDA